MKRVRLTLSAYWFVVHSYIHTFFRFIVSPVAFTLVSIRPRPIIITTAPIESVHSSYTLYTHQCNK